MRRLAVLLLAIAPIVAIAVPSRADACSFPEGVRRVAVLPADGATAVPTNTQIQVTYDAFNSWGFTDEVGVRPVGQATTVPATITRDRYNWDQLVTVQPSAPLAAATAYEIVDIVPDCEEFIENCAATEPEVIGTFTTGAGPDEVAPTTGTITVGARFIDLEPRSSCGEGSQLVVTPRGEGLTDPGTAPEQLRIRVYDVSGRPLTGAFTPSSAHDSPGSPKTAIDLGGFCTGRGAPSYDVSLDGVRNPTVAVIVRAVDLAGNEDASAGTVVIPGCPSFDANNDGYADDGQVVDPGEEPIEDDIVYDDDGCSAAPGAGPLAGLGIGLGALLRRRRRAAAG